MAGTRIAWAHGDEALLGTLRHEFDCAVEDAEALGVSSTTLARMREIERSTDRERPECMLAGLRAMFTACLDNIDADWDGERYRGNAEASMAEDLSRTLARFDLHEVRP